MYVTAEDFFDHEEEEALLRIINRIREYTCFGVMFSPPEDIAISDAYVEQGVADLESYLGKYAAFEEFLEGSDTSA